MNEGLGPYDLACDGYGSVPAKFMFVGISAGRLGALVSKVPLTRDASGRLFQRCLKQLGLSESEESCEAPILKDAYVTNLVKGRCLTEKGLNRLPTDKEVAFWWPRMASEIAMVQPDRIIALGDFVARRLERKGVRPSGLGGRLYWAYHPRWYASHGALRNGSPAFAKMVADYRERVFG